MSFSKVATARQFNWLSFGSFQERSFRLWIAWCCICTARAILGLTIIHPVIRVQDFVKWLINFRWLFRLSHFGTLFISFGATRCFFCLTSEMIIWFWSYPLAKRGCWKCVGKMLFVFISSCHQFGWQTLSVDVSAILFAARDQVLSKRGVKNSCLTILIIISMQG